MTQIRQTRAGETISGDTATAAGLRAANEDGARIVGSSYRAATPAPARG